MGGRIDIAQRGWQNVKHDHDHDHLVTKVRCMDLPDSDRGDFSCRLAIDSSSLFICYLLGYAEIISFWDKTYFFDMLKFLAWSKHGVLGYNFVVVLNVLVDIPVMNVLNTLRPRQNGRHFPDDNFKWIFLNKKVWIVINISLKSVPRGPMNNIPTLVQLMAWCRPGAKPLSEQMMVRLLTHICVTWPQWVKMTGTMMYCVFVLRFMLWFDSVST